jgi:hypothetical protein
MRSLLLLFGIGSALFRPMTVSSLQAQSPSRQGPESASAPVAVLTASLYNDQANLREASDSAQAALATTAIRTQLTDSLGAQLVSFALLDSLAESPEARAISGGPACHVKVRCAITIAATAGARWVVLVKVSKTSNLIWLLSAQLIRVANGEILLDDSTELKGDPAKMVPIGVRQFANRVVRTVRAGGYTTNYPNGEPQS